LTFCAVRGIGRFKISDSGECLFLTGTCLGVVIVEVDSDFTWGVTLKDITADALIGGGVTAEALSGDGGMTADALG